MMDLQDWYQRETILFGIFAAFVTATLASENFSPARRFTPPWACTRENTDKTSPHLDGLPALGWADNPRRWGTPPLVKVITIKIDFVWADGLLHFAGLPLLPDVSTLPCKKYDYVAFPCSYLQIGKYTIKQTDRQTLENKQTDRYWQTNNLTSNKQTNNVFLSQVCLFNKLSSLCTSV